MAYFANQHPIQPYIAMAEKALQIEAEAIQALASKLNDQFIHTVDAILECKGRVILIGVGKSGLIAKKIAATFASTGTPSFFVHATEASHGDLGMITEQDIAIALSNSGDTPELIEIIPAIKRRGATLISITGNLKSTLAIESKWVLDASVKQEACPLNLAPTASTTAALALGDALAVVVLKARGFNEDDFARSHPGGSLGRKLLTHVKDVMRTQQRIPKVRSQQALSQALLEMTNKGLGMTTIVDDNNTLLGIFTDGDLRRLVELNQDIRHLTVNDVMNPKPCCISAEQLAVEAVNMMENLKISQLVVVDSANRVVGALNFHDLFEAKVV